MIPHLIPGDNVLVLKYIPGARIFNVWGKWEQLSMKRLPGKKIKRNDVLVYNYPYAKDWGFIQMDIMVYHVKRCIGLPGDTISIENGFYKIKGVNIILGNLAGQEKIAKADRNYLEEMELFYSYPEDSVFNWNIKNFGPLYIPARGDTILLDRINITLYKKLIEWEQQVSLVEDSVGGIYLNDLPVYQYIFNENYYFVAGDKVENSQDSRYWGLLPESFIVGKAWLIWRSVDRSTGEFRWNRFLKKID